MIEGIEVLNKTPVMEMGEHIEIAYIITVVLFALFLMITIVIGANCKSSTILSIFGIITLVLFITLSLLQGHKVETGRYEYQCTISDNILFIDMYEKYEVVSKDGELWTIRDKEVPNVN